MKNECNIVHDLLPLYLEDMVSDDTADFIKEHLDSCAECRAEFESLKSNDEIIPKRNETEEQRKNGANALITIKKKLRKKKLIAISVTAVCLIVVVALLHLFPVYRIAKVGGTSFYNGSEIAKLAYIGSSTDRAEAQSVLRQADAAFQDCRHTDTENKKMYGVLSRYATNAERGAVFSNHSLELWSAHLGTSEGYLWVYYSCEVFDSRGNTISGSWKIPSLWKVEKDDNGAWVVVGIKEHP